jgi:2-C-methyl-D-erythritol 2,4-cyclodiphosphate synthase/2-C-methyl-D-erythritol 4-phosphate cytidylyltransferase
MMTGTNPITAMAHKTWGRVHVLIPAAGRGARFGTAENKIFALLAGRSVIARTVGRFGGIADTVTVIGRSGELARISRETGVGGSVSMCAGGETRQESVRLGLETLHADPDDVVLVHDGARPLVSQTLIESCVATVLNHGSVLAAVPISETVKLADDLGSVSATRERAGLWCAQTPQGATFRILTAAFDRAFRDGFVGTDESSLIERLDNVPAPRIVLGSRENVKITTPEDIEFARRWLSAQDASRPPMRVGIGYDIHRFAAGRRLVLGGVEIAGEQGLLGHSDADVILHAICDALLGAAGLPDIGCLFPNTDNRYVDISSVVLLVTVIARVHALGYRVGNIDCCVIAERPKISPYASQMRSVIASAVQSDVQCVSVKATTNEEIGALGAGEGIACHATAVIVKNQYATLGQEVGASN